WVIIPATAVRRYLKVAVNHLKILPRSSVGNFGVPPSRREGRIPGDPIDLSRCIVHAGGQPPWPGIWSDRDRSVEYCIAAQLCDFGCVRGIEERLALQRAINAGRDAQTERMRGVGNAKMPLPSRRER